MYVCINVCMIISVWVLCMLGCMHDYVYVCIYSCVYVCVCVCRGCVCGYMCLVICYNDADLFVRSEPGNKRPRPDLDLCSLWTWHIGDSQTDPWMIRRSVSVRAVKTRQWFGSKTASFHVSVYFCLVSYFTIVNMYLFYFYLFMWLFNVL